MAEDTAVTVTIEGLPPNDNDYDEDAFNRRDLELRERIQQYWAAGARAENLEEAISQALTEAV